MTAFFFKNLAQSIFGMHLFYISNDCCDLINKHFTFSYLGSILTFQIFLLWHGTDFFTNPTAHYKNIKIFYIILTPLAKGHIKSKSLVLDYLKVAPADCKQSNNMWFGGPISVFWIWSKTPTYKNNKGAFKQRPLEEPLPGEVLLTLEWVHIHKDLSYAVIKDNGWFYPAVTPFTKGLSY